MKVQLTETEIQKWIHENVVPKMASLNANCRSEFASQIMHLGYEISRGIEGNDFARGFLEAALKDLDTNPPFVVIREPS